MKLADTRHRRRIVVVDRSDVVAEGLAKLLVRQLDIDAASCRLDALADEKGRADAAIIDLRLGHDAPERLLGEICRLLPGTPVVAVGTPSTGPLPKAVRGIVSRDEGGAHELVRAVGEALGLGMSTSRGPSERVNGARPNAHLLNGHTPNGHTPNGARVAAIDGARHSRLTPREQEVLGHLRAGQRTRRIAEEMGISPHTVRSHIRRLSAKIGASSRLEAVMLAHERGMVTEPMAFQSAGGPVE